MIIIFDDEQIVEVKWNTNNIKYFTAKGYKFTKRGDIIYVKAKELKPKSSALVKCVCDYCGEEYIVPYFRYTKSIERGKLACVNCKKDKMRDSFLNKYGIKSVGESKEFRGKAKKKMLERYGCEYVLQSEIGRKHFEASMLERYGATNPSHCPELKEKARLLSYLDDEVKVNVSKPEKKMVEMLYKIYGKDNCFPSFPVGNCFCDCLLLKDDIKIDIEYDGWYWHKDKQDSDRKRNYYLLNRGFRIVRIKGNNRDTLPTEEQLKSAINTIIQNNKHLIYIDMNN